jgi:hypothetical protein
VFPQEHFQWSVRQSAFTATRHHQVLFPPDHFPLGEIIDRFKGTTKNYSFDDDFLDMLLDLRFGDRDALYVLRLLQGSLDPEKAYEQDHLHPHSAFNDEEQLKTVFSDPTDYAFARDQANWNSLANMQLLEKNQQHQQIRHPLT